MAKQKIYVVEDMAFTRAALIELLIDSNYEVVGSSASAEKAWGELTQLAVDLVLLDINLATEKDGIWLAQKIREQLQLPIVFLTAYGDDETLAKLDGVKPNGYLMKPYNKPTIITTIKIAINAFKTSQNKAASDVEQFIIIDEGARKTKIALIDINFVVSDGNYIEIHTKGKIHTTRNQLASFFKALPSNDFILQTHRRFLINKNKIKSLTTTSILINDTVIPVSKTFKTNVQSLF